MKPVAPEDRPRGYCEYGWQRGLLARCPKRARHVVQGEMRCGEHKDAK